MNYKLAKKLKDAGFGNYIENVIDEDTGCRFTDIYMPTLSKLIKECGKYFNEMHRIEEDKWSVVCYSLFYSTVYGKTPEEAVAKLWIELNKK